MHLSRTSLIIFVFCHSLLFLRLTDVVPVKKLQLSPMKMQDPLLLLCVFHCFSCNDHNDPHSNDHEYCSKVLSCSGPLAGWWLGWHKWFRTIWCSSFWRIQPKVPAIGVPATRLQLGNSWDDLEHFLDSKTVDKLGYLGMMPQWGLHCLHWCLKAFKDRSTRLHEHRWRKRPSCAKSAEGSEGLTLALTLHLYS